MQKLGRNDLCHCGSGKKFKKCHALKSEAERQSRFLMLVVGGLLVAGVAVGVASYTGKAASGTRVWSPEHGHYHDANGLEIR
jgi:SEC-C motif